MATLEEITAKFEADMENAYVEPLKNPHRYNATYFRRLLDEFGAVETAKMLIDRDEIPYGLDKLYHIGKLHCSVEAIILKPEYRVADFEPSIPERRKKARQRLQSFNNYTAPWDIDE